MNASSAYSTCKSLSAASALCLGALGSSSASTILSESFESTIDSRISIGKVGSFGQQPGVIATTKLGSTKAFGYGLSTCGASCFDNYASTLTIDLGNPTFITSISFREIELFGNWGSDGSVSLDGKALNTGFRDFGRLPYNDFQADSTFRTKSFDINKAATKIQIRVGDITNQSEIAIDNLVVTSVPEPASALMIFTGLGVVAMRCRTAKNTRCFWRV